MVGPGARVRRWAGTSGEGTAADTYSTSNAGNPANAWNVDVNDGNVNANNKNNALRVRAVRGRLVIGPDPYSFRALWRQYRHCRRNKRSTHNALAFEVDAEAGLLALQQELRDPRTVRAVHLLRDPGPALQVLWRLPACEAGGRGIIRREPSMALSTQEIVRLLEQNAPVIRRYGVRSLGLFGSGARGTAQEDSDLDFVVEFETKSFDAYMDLKAFLEQLFGCQVDLVLRDTIKPSLRETILKEALHAPGL
jgi:hypothetical protein